MEDSGGQQIFICIYLFKFALHIFIFTGMAFGLWYAAEWRRHA
jgi:hypothetical protein